MSFWTLITYTRPNTDTEWYQVNDEAKAYIESLKADDGANPSNISYEKLESNDGLKQYYKLNYKDGATADLLQESDIGVANETARENYCSSNNIVFTEELVGETEPSVTL